MSRLFVHGGVNQVRRNGSNASGVKLIEVRFSEYQRLMETKTAREVAKEQYKWMKEHVIRRWTVEADTCTYWLGGRHGHG